MGHAVAVTGLVAAIALPDGTPVRGRGRREPLPPGPLPEFGLYLGKTRPLAARAGPPSGWTGRTSASPATRSRPPPSIVGAYEQARGGRRVEVACGGGVGRTGTVIACMAVLAGHPADDAVAWTRRTYRRRAVETPGQRRWVRWFATHTS